MMFVETLRTTSEDAPSDRADSTGQHCMRQTDTSELETGARTARKRDTSSRNGLPRASNGIDRILIAAIARRNQAECRKLLMIGRLSPRPPAHRDAAHRESDWHTVHRRGDRLQF